MKAKILALLLISSGAILFTYGIYLVRQRNSPVDLNSTNAYAVTTPNASSPIEIEIPSINLQLPIKPTTIINGKWENPGKSVGYWIDSPLPGSKGNSVFYGHNWQAIFGKLKNVKVGDLITISFETGESKTFVVKNKSTVTSDQTHILEQTDDTRITLYTCTGFLDFKRLVVVAVPN